MTYKQVEASREVRLWISQVVFPVIVTVGLMLTKPEFRATAKAKTAEFRDKIKAKFNK